MDAIVMMIKFVYVAFSLFVLEVSGHGMMLGPPGRSSLWRFDDEAPINYNDNQNFCGGIQILWEQNGGKCGVCGDDYSTPHPQSNENTGTYGTGKVVANYTRGEIIETSVLLTANHLGYFEYHLCALDDPNTFETGEDCFKLLNYADGTSKYPIEEHYEDITNYVKLPDDYTCAHCILRWHYVAANNWGVCEDGSIAPGCGPQEVFRSCADISIF